MGDSKYSFFLTTFRVVPSLEILSCSSILLQPIGEASANRACSHGSQIRPDLARDQRYDPFSNRFRVLSSLAIGFVSGREVRGLIYPVLSSGVVVLGSPRR
jgi:hypothetical protein